MGGAILRAARGRSGPARTETGPKDLKNEGHPQRSRSARWDAILRATRGRTGSALRQARSRALRYPDRRTHHGLDVERALDARLQTHLSLTRPRRVGSKSPLGRPRLSERVRHRVEAGGRFFTREPEDAVPTVRPGREDQALVQGILRNAGSKATATALRGSPAGSRARRSPRPAFRRGRILPLCRRRRERYEDAAFLVLRATGVVHHTHEAPARLRLSFELLREMGLDQARNIRDARVGFGGDRFAECSCTRAGQPDRRTCKKGLLTRIRGSSAVPGDRPWRDTGRFRSLGRSCSRRPF